MTQKERLATLEAQHEAQRHEQELLHQLWSVQLEAIDVRLANIEAALHQARLEPNGGPALRRISRRDLGISGGSIAAATVIWWVFELLRTTTGG